MNRSEPSLLPAQALRAMAACDARGALMNLNAALDAQEQSRQAPTADDKSALDQVDRFLRTAAAAKQVLDRIRAQAPNARTPAELARLRQELDSAKNSMKPCSLGVEPELERRLN